MSDLSDTSLLSTGDTQELPQLEWTVAGYSILIQWDTPTVTFGQGVCWGTKQSCSL